MRVFFLAERQCALTAGGAYLGMIDGFCRAAEVNPADNIFFEISPCGGFLPVRFCLDEEFLLSPPPHIELYYSGADVAVYAFGFERSDQSMKILKQETIAGARLTLFVQGKVRLDLQTEQGFFLVSLPDRFENAVFSAHGEDFLLQGEGMFALVGRDGALKLMTEGRVVSEEEPLEGEIDFHDSRGHTARCRWKDGKLLSCAIRAAREPTETTFALALFESALIGADCTPYLAPALAEKADSLREFLGDYRSVVLTDFPDVAGLIYKRGERIFETRYFRVETKEGKIANILPADPPETT